MKRLASLWLAFFTASAGFFYSQQSLVETHQFEKVLHWGYDTFGRNCIPLTLCAAFESFLTVLPVGLFCLLLSLLFSILGLNSHQRLQFVFRSALDTLSSLPGFLIALAISVFFPNPLLVFFIAAFFHVFPSLTRFWESQILKLRSESYIKASESLGAGPVHLFRFHYLPELARILAAISPFILTRLLLIETSLSFLGLSTTPEHDSWGRLLYQGKDYLIEAPWILAMTSIPLCLTLFSFHLLSRAHPN